MARARGAKSLRILSNCAWRPSYSSRICGDNRKAFKNLGKPTWLVRSASASAEVSRKRYAFASFSVAICKKCNEWQAGTSSRA